MGSLSIGERFHARQLAAAKKFQRSAATSGDVRNLVGQTRLVNGRDRITTTDDGSSARGGRCGHRLGYSQSSLGKSGYLENAHGPVPYDRFRLGDFRDIGSDGFRS